MDLVCSDDAPTQIGSYDIGRRIGGGGMGDVFEAQHRILDRRVAVKILHRTTPEHTERFFNEAKVAASIRHPGVVEILDIGMDPDGRVFMIMELLEGKDLAFALIRKRRFEELEAVDVAIQIADALAAAHALGVVHRDLKPDNIFLTPSKRGDSVKASVLDFGVARAVEYGGMTKIGQILGTPQYMAPELHFGADRADARSDIYSLGCILYEMVTGRPPFIGVGAEVMAKHQHQKPEPPRHRVPGLSAELQMLILSMLSKAPGERPPNTAEVLRGLSQVRSLLVPAPEPETEGVSFTVSRVMVGIAIGLALAALISIVT